MENETNLPRGIVWRNQAKKGLSHYIGKTRRLLFKGPQDLARIERSIDIRLKENPKGEIIIVNLTHPGSKKR